MRFLLIFLFYTGCSPAFAQTQLGPAKNLYLTPLALPSGTCRDGDLRVDLNAVPIALKMCVSNVWNEISGAIDSLGDIGDVDLSTPPSNGQALVWSTDHWEAGTVAPTVSDTNSVDLTVAGTTISADLKLSADSPSAGNITTTNSIVSDGLKIQVPIATGAVTGVLSSSDWTTFDGKQDAGNYITALTGDVAASGPGSAAASIQSGVITNSMVSGSAAVARSKLANGTANRVAVNDVSGVLSDAAAITASRALISDANGIPTHSAVTSTELAFVSGVTSSLCGINQSCTLTNKTLTSPVLNNATLSLDIGSLNSQDVATSATINALSADKPVTRLTGSTATTLNGIDSTSGKNKVVTVSNVSTALITVSHQSSSASANDRIITTTGTSQYIIPNSSADFLYDATQSRWVFKGSGNLSYAFPQDVFSAKVATTGGVSDENSDWISGNCTNATPMVCTLVTGVFSTGPNCVASTNSSTADAVCKVATISATEVRIRCNDGATNNTTSVAKQLYCQKAGSDAPILSIRSDQTNYPPTAYTPTFTGLGTVSGTSFFHERKGQMLHVYGCTTTGTVAASLFSATLPGTLAIDSTKIPVSNTSAAAGHIVGDYSVDSQLNATGRIVTATGTSTTLVYASPVFNGSSANQTPANGSAISGNSDLLCMDFQVPISGWTETANAPLFIGSVTSNTTTSERIERVQFSGGTFWTDNCGSSPCTINSQTGSWVTSVTRAATGRYDVNIASGMFSSTPTCTFSGLGRTVHHVSCSMDDDEAPTSTKISIRCESTDDGASAATDSSVQMICMGPR